MQAPGPTTEWPGRRTIGRDDRVARGMPRRRPRRPRLQVMPGCRPASGVRSEVPLRPPGPQPPSPRGAPSPAPSRRARGGLPWMSRNASPAGASGTATLYASARSPRTWIWPAIMTWSFHARSAASQLDSHASATSAAAASASTASIRAAERPNLGQDVVAPHRVRHVGELSPKIDGPPADVGPFVGRRVGFERVVHPAVPDPGVPALWEAVVVALPAVEGGSDDAGVIAGERRQCLWKVPAISAPLQLDMRRVLELDWKAGRNLRDRLHVRRRRFECVWLPSHSANVAAPSRRPAIAGAMGRAAGQRRPDRLVLPIRGREDDAQGCRDGRLPAAKEGAMTKQPHRIAPRSCT